MNPEGQLLLTFGLLGIAICAVWLPPIRIGERLALPLWPFLFIGSLISGLHAGYLDWPAVPALGLLALAGWFATRPVAQAPQRILFGALAVLIAPALAMHRLPGFDSPVLIAQVQFSPDAAPFTQRANFDKAAVGLMLLAFFCRRARNASDWKLTISRTIPIAAVTAVAITLIATAIGYVRPDFKWPRYAPLFLAVNLLFTCVAEEAFFRGFVQERLSTLLHRLRFGALIAISASAILFGLAHFAGGARYVLLSTLAGVGYACAYARTRSIEAPILTHFVTNAVHFVGFTYPYLL